MLYLTLNKEKAMKNNDQQRIMPGESINQFHTKLNSALVTSANIRDKEESVCRMEGQKITEIKHEH
jgi:hypothetical protein